MTNRRTERLFLRVPVALSGEDSTGKPLAQEANTIHISRDGALVRLDRLPRPGSLLAIRNLSNGLVADSRIVHTRDAAKGARAECGIELVDAPRDFWGIVFEDPGPPTESRVSALLVCTNCGQRVFAALSPEEYKGMESDSAIDRHCPRCDRTTGWMVGPSEEEEEEPPRPLESSEPAREQTVNPPAEKSGIERRQARRLALKVPLRVRSAAGSTEATVAEDMSKTGFKFACSLEFSLGELIQISVGQGVAANPPVHMYKVVWRTPKEKSSRYLYGVTIVER